MKERYLIITDEVDEVMRKESKKKGERTEARRRISRGVRTEDREKKD
jgi:hypothetical protein